MHNTTFSFNLLCSRLIILLGLIYISYSAKAQCLKPIGLDTSICLPAAITLSAVSSSDLIRWYDSADGYSFLDTGATFSTPLISSTRSFYVAQFDTGAVSRSIRLDGVNDYAAIEKYNYSSATNTEVTVESWIKTTNGGNQIIASYDRSEYWRLEVNGSGAGTGQIGFDVLTNAGQLDFGGNIRIDDGVWHHIACVYDNGVVSIYIDGVLDATTNRGTLFGSGITRYGMLGVGSEAPIFNGTTGPNDYFDGDIGMLRVWSVARTQTQLQQSMNSCFLGKVSGLEVNYEMDGTAAQNFLTDYSGNKNNGFLRNVTLPGAWIAGGPSLNGCTICESDRDTSEIELVPSFQNFATVDTCIAGDSITLDASPGYISYLWQDNSTNQTLKVFETGVYSVTVETLGKYGSAICNATDSIRVFINSKPIGIDTNFCGPGNYSIESTSSTGLYKWYNSAVSDIVLDTGDLNLTISATDTFYVAAFDTASKGNALTFTAANNNYGAINSYLYSNTNYTELTIEGWIRTTNENDQIIASFDRSEYWRLEINGDGGGPGQIGFDIRTNSGILDFGSTTRVDDGIWHHIAAVYDNGSVLIYIDGVLDNSTTRGSTFGSGVNRYGFLGTGSEADSYNGSRGPNSYFDGDIATFNLWNRALSQIEIQENQYNCKIGSEPGLEIAYNFTEGSGTFISDLTGNNRNSVLQNFNPPVAWNDNGPTIFGCPSICESERDTVIVSINPEISSSDVIVNCPGIDSTLVEISPLGGSGNFDYRELSGEFNYSGAFEPVSKRLRFINNSSFSVEVIDENQCLDTTITFTTPSTPTTIAGANSTGICRILDQNQFAFIVNGSNEVIAAVKSENEDLGNVEGFVYVQPNSIVYSDEAYLGRHFLINSDSSSFTTAQVRLFYTDSEFTDLVDSANSTSALNDDLSSITDLGVTKYNGPTEDNIFDPSDATSLVYIPQTSSGTSLGGNYLEFSLNSFSEFWIHSSGSNTPLPIELLSFSAEELGNGVKVKWVTLSEINNDYFVLERANNNTDFYEIAKINGSGNSTNLLEYIYIDTKSRAEYTYYRLKQVDFDGAYSYSNTIAVSKNERNNQDQLILYPNPARTNINIKYSSQYLGSVAIFDASGVIYFQEDNFTLSDSPINVSYLKPGVYFLKLTSENAIHVERFIIYR